MDLMEDGTETMLWADKYCPREYMQLLSDDVRRGTEGKEERVKKGGRKKG